MTTVNDKDRVRFWRKVDKTAQCWLWTSACDGKGYPQFSLAGRKVHAHRLAYEMLHGTIPSGMEIDHLCRVRACVNPGHLDVVSHAENLRRGNCGMNLLRSGKVGIMASPQRPLCIHGHAYTPENTYYYPSGPRAGRRECRACRAMRHKVNHKPSEQQ